MKGTVKTKKTEKGYGFLRDEEGIDRFFHVNSLEGINFDTLNEGDKVEFEPYEQEGKGLRARRIRRAA